MYEGLHEYAPGIVEALERSDWTPEEALRWYAAGNHFDTFDNRTRIIDTGAIASNALKHASLQHLELKGDAELSELRAEVEALRKVLQRYRWLRLRIAVSQLSVLGAECSNTVEGVDAGIDAAMSAELPK